MVKDLYINVHYNKNFVDMNNINKLGPFDDLTANLTKKESIYLLR